MNIKYKHLIEHTITLPWLGNQDQVQINMIPHSQDPRASGRCLKTGQQSSQLQKTQNTINIHTTM